MDHVVIPIVGMMIPVILVPVILGLRHARHERELEHAERMRALELGRTLPQDESFWTPPKICVSIGVGVPIAVMGFAWLATQTAGFREEIWVMSGMVGMTSVLSGTLLTSRYLSQRARADEIAAAYPQPKAPFDADAYDVVGTRG